MGPSIITFGEALIIIITPSTASPSLTGMRAGLAYFGGTATLDLLHVLNLREKYKVPNKTF